MIYVKDGHVKVEGKMEDLTLDCLGLMYSLMQGDTFDKEELEFILKMASNTHLEYVDLTELKKQAKGEEND